MKLFLSVISFFVLMGSQPYTHTENTGENTIRPVTAICGRVTDKLTGEELTGVVLQITGTGLKTFSDLKGEFGFHGLPPGAYQLTAAMISYREGKLVNIEVSQGERKELSVELKLD